MIRNNAQKVKKQQTCPSNPGRIQARESPDGGYIPTVKERLQVQEIPSHTQSHTPHPTTLSQPDIHLKLQSMDDISNPYYVNMPPSMPDVRSASVFDMHRETIHVVGFEPDEGRIRPILTRGNAKKNRQGEPKVVHFENTRTTAPQLTPVQFKTSTTKTGKTATELTPAQFETTKTGKTATQPTPVRFETTQTGKTSSHHGTDQDHSPQYRTDTRPAPHSHTPTRHGAIQRRNPPSHVQNKHQKKLHPSPEEQLNKVCVSCTYEIGVYSVH